MPLIWIPYVEARYEPACYADYALHRQLYQRLSFGTDDVCMVAIEVVAEQPCTTIAGPTQFLTWKWRNCELQTCQGHLHEKKFKDEAAYRVATGCVCRLFVER